MNQQLATRSDVQAKADRVRQVLLQSWRSSSDRQIALREGVSNRTVSLLRKELESEGRIIPRCAGTQSTEASQYEVCTTAIEPAALNDELYDPIDESEPSFLALAESIREHGILEPIVISGDGYILSGHRRHAAARHLQLERLPVRVRHDVSYLQDEDQFLRLLASYNRQRVKTTAEQVREEVVLMSAASSYRIRRFRENAATTSGAGSVELRDRKRRSAIRDKLELRDAILKVIRDEERNWPLSDRAVHYRLLNIPGLVRNDKTRVPYGIPFGGRTICLPKVVKSIHDFLARNARKLADEDDPLLNSDVASPALERYREERAAMARLDRLEREGQLVARADVREGLGRVASILRAAGDGLQQQFGPEAVALLNESIDDAEREIERFFSGDLHVVPEEPAA